MGKIFDKFMNTMRLNGDDYEEEYTDWSLEDRCKRTTGKVQTSSEVFVTHRSKDDSKEERCKRNISPSKEKPYETKAEHNLDVEEVEVDQV